MGDAEVMVRRREVEHRLAPLEGRADRLGVAEVAADEAIERQALARRDEVESRDAMPLAPQRVAEVLADESGGTGDKESHGHSRSYGMG